jgi:hypothetical protein
MNSATFLRLFACVIALAIVSPASIASDDPKQVSVRDIVTQQTRLREQAVAGKGAFKDMKRPDRAALIERQDRVIATLGATESLDEMSPQARTDVFNDLEWIKAMVTKAEEERIICEYTRAVGSNRAVSVCMTAREHREYREGAQMSLRRAYKCDNCGGD